MSNTPTNRPRRFALKAGGAMGLAPLLIGSGAATAQYGSSYGRAPAPTPAPAPVPAAPPSTALAATPGAPTGPVDEVRLALLLGNNEYPAQQDLPPIPKNIRDLKASLEAKGFAVTDALNLDLPRSRAAIDAFSRTVAASPPNATIFFYFAGHGVQDQARNLLISAGVNPSVLGDVQNGSLELNLDVVGPLAPRTTGATYAVIDSCRVSLRSALRDRDGLNQVEAPVGCLIAFSTAAGKPAISSALPTENTFYTASLVKVLNASSEDTSFVDLFKMVRRDVRDTMLNHPIKEIRMVAQDPFIADNTRVNVPLHRRSAAQIAQAQAATQAEEESLWREIQAGLWPADIVRLCSKYIEQFPQGRRRQSVEVALEGAQDSAKILQRNDVKLYKSSFHNTAAQNPTLQQDIARAARGDKDAAKRIGVIYKDGSTGQELGRYEGWLQYAAWLGNGIASYDLALLYRKLDQPDLAARYESRARELGFTPPPSLKSGLK